MMIDIYKYKDAIEYLESSFKEKCQKNSNYSLRSWAKHLGLKDSASLSAVLRRKRKISRSLANKLRAGLGLDEQSLRYFDIICRVSNSSDQLEREFFSNLANDFRPYPERCLIDLEEFDAFVGWYHFVILEMTRLSDFNPDVNWIYQRLGKTVSKKDIKDGIDRLIKLGYLKALGDGSLVQSQNYLKTSNGVPSAALRSIHRQHIQKALEAIDSQGLDQRDITGFNTVTSAEKVIQAKEKIRNFRSELAAFLEDPQGDTVYQVNVQMFDLLS